MRETNAITTNHSITNLEVHAGEVDEKSAKLFRMPRGVNGDAQKDERNDHEQHGDEGCHAKASQDS